MAESLLQYTMERFINKERIVVLNESVDGSGKKVLKKWENRMDKEHFVESDVNKRLLFSLPFTANVKLSGICFIGRMDGSFPSCVRIFKNRVNMSFDEAESANPDLEMALTQDSAGLVDYPLTAFNSVGHLTLHFPANFGEDKTCIYYIGLRGEFHTKVQEVLTEITVKVDDIERDVVEDKIEAKEFMRDVKQLVGRLTESVDEKLKKGITNDSVCCLFSVWHFRAFRQFHYHPTFMAIGMLFLQGEAILVYRVFRNERMLAVCALKAVWDSHDFHRSSNGELQPLPNLYSLHCWFGISAVSFYFVQFIVGFLTFLFPGFSLSMRKFLLPFHQLFGVLIFICCSIAALLGILEYAAWHNRCWTVDHNLCAQHLVSNLFGLSLVGYCFSVLLMVVNRKRKPLPEEECLNTMAGDEE